MALDIAGGVVARLAGDETLAGMLATYRAGPAVFSDPPPSDYEVDALPSLIVAEPHDNGSNDDATNAYREPTLRVRGYIKPDGSGTRPLLEAMERARRLFSNVGDIPFSTGTLQRASVNGPTPAPTSDPSIEGRLLILQLRIKE